MSVVESPAIHENIQMANSPESLGSEVRQIPNPKINPFIFPINRCLK